MAKLFLRERLSGIERAGVSGAQVRRCGKRETAQAHGMQPISGSGPAAPLDIHRSSPFGV